MVGAEFFFDGLQIMKNTHLVTFRSLFRLKMIHPCLVFSRDQDQQKIIKKQFHEHAPIFGVLNKERLNFNKIYLLLCGSKTIRDVTIFSHLYKIGL